MLKNTLRLIGHNTEDRETTRKQESDTERSVVQSSKQRYSRENMMHPLHDLTRYAHQFNDIAAGGQLCQQY